MFRFSGDDDDNNYTAVSFCLVVHAALFYICIFVLLHCEPMSNVTLQVTVMRPATSIITARRIAHSALHSTLITMASSSDCLPVCLFA